MVRQVRVDREELTAQMRSMVEQTPAQVMDAVNAAIKREAQTEHRNKNRGSGNRPFLTILQLRRMRT
jgi:hypothetical protein